MQRAQVRPACTTQVIVAKLSRHCELEHIGIVTVFQQGLGQQLAIGIVGDGIDLAAHGGIVAVHPTDQLAPGRQERTGQQTVWPDRAGIGVKVRPARNDRSDRGMISGGQQLGRGPRVGGSIGADDAVGPGL